MIDSILTIKNHKVIVVKYFNEHVPLRDADEWFCMYIEIDTSIPLPTFLHNETFKSNNIVGIDTRHMCYNYLSLNRKYDAAIHQITELIDDYERFIV